MAGIYSKLSVYICKHVCLLLSWQQKDSFTKALAKKTQLKKKAVTTKTKTTVVLVPKTTAPVVSQDGKTSGDVSWEVVELSQGSQSSQGSRSSQESLSRYFSDNNFIILHLKCLKPNLLGYLEHDKVKV